MFGISFPAPRRHPIAFRSKRVGNCTCKLQPGAEWSGLSPRFMKRLLIAILVLGIIAAGSWWFLRDGSEKEQEDAVQAKIDRVERRTIKEEVVATGTIKPAASSEVRSEVSGRISKVFVREGEAAKLGQPLLELDQTQLRSDINAAELGIQLAELDAEKLQADLKRQEQLRDSNLVTEKAFTDTRADASKATIEVKIKRAQLDRLKSELAKTTILAPISGTVLDLAAREGMVITGASSVSEGTVLMEIAELDRLIVESDINEIDVAKLEESMPVTVTFDSMPDLEANAELAFIAPSATEQPGQNNNQNVARTFQIIAALERLEAGIKPGMSANLSIQVGVADDVLSLPISAIFMEEDEAFVYRQSAPEEKHAVEIGISDARHIEIESGLEEEEAVLLERPAPSPTPEQER